MKIEGVIKIIGHEIPKERISDLLCDAFEGGSIGWYQIRYYTYPPGKSKVDFDFPHIQVPLFEGGSILIDDGVEAQFVGKVLNLESIQKGLQLLHDKYCNHFNDLLTENDDADTGDIFLQLCLFGEVVFS